MATYLARPAKILIVEDCADVCCVLEQVIRKLGCESVTAMDGEEAIRQLRTNKFLAVVLDIRLPKIDGYGVLRYMRDAGCHLPVIILTAYADEQVYKLVDTYGVFGVLTKPFFVESLLQDLHRYFSIFRVKHAYPDSEQQGEVPPCTQVLAAAT